MCEMMCCTIFVGPLRVTLLLLRYYYYDDHRPPINCYNAPLTSPDFFD